jgi:hypothetical protein
MKDRVLICIQCEKKFVFSVVEQEYFISMGFDEPKRCPLCRKNKSKAANLKGTRRNNDKKKYFRRKYEN